MAIPNDNAYVIRSYVEKERGVFGLNALRGMPGAIRRQLLEAIILAVNWETTVVAAGATYNAVAADVVILAGSTGVTPTKFILSAVAGDDGRVFVIKDTDGNASNNGIEIHVSNPGTEKIDDAASTTFNLNSDFGAVVFVSDTTANKWYTIAFAG